MSQITVENIKRSSETVARSTRGVAAAWVNFDGTGTIAARDSENVSSLTDNGTGDYTVNFTSAFAAADWSCVVASGATNYRITTTNTGSTNIKTSNSSYVLSDSTLICQSGHGDLA